MKSWSWSWSWRKSLAVFQDFCCNSWRQWALSKAHHGILWETTNCSLVEMSSRNMPQRVHCARGKWNPVNKDHAKRRNWTRYWRRIVWLTWWLNVWKRKNTNVIRWLSFFGRKWMSIFVFVSFLAVNGTSFSSAFSFTAENEKMLFGLTLTSVLISFAMVSSVASCHRCLWALPSFCFALAYLLLDR